MYDNVKIQFDLRPSDTQKTDTILLCTDENPRICLWALPNRLIPAYVTFDEVGLHRLNCFRIGLGNNILSYDSAYFTTSSSLLDREDV